MIPSEFGARVRNELAKNGWIRYQSYSDEGMCLMGASSAVLLTTPDCVGASAEWNRAVERKIVELEPQYEGRAYLIPVFNDEALLDEQDAINFCDKVIAGLQEAGQ